MMNTILYIARIALCLITPVYAVYAESNEPFSFPISKNMNMTFEKSTEYELLSIPRGVLQNGKVPAQKVSGPVLRRGWRSVDATISVDQFADNLKKKVVSTGYRVVLDCNDTECGGFEFSNNVDILPAPFIYVNLMNFRFMTFKSKSQYKTILVSKVANSLSLQINEVAEGEKLKSTAFQFAKFNIKQPGLVHLSSALENNGYAVLEDLEYQSGSSHLGEGPFQSLVQLARYLKVNQTERIILVGHTDDVGSLLENINLSKKRATAVVDRLVKRYGIKAERLSSHGVGYLNPIARNNTKKGRELNRRVEVVLGKSE